MLEKLKQVILSWWEEITGVAELVRDLQDLNAQLSESLKRGERQALEIYALKDDLLQARCSVGKKMQENRIASRALALATDGVNRLNAEMEANRITKAHLDEQAAIQLEMDGHRVGMELELETAKLRAEKAERLQWKYLTERNAAIKDADAQKALRTNAQSELAVAMQYKPLYQSCLEDIKKLRKKSSDLTKPITAREWPQL